MSLKHALVSSFKALAVAAAISLVAVTAASAANLPRGLCESGEMQCEYVLTYGWVCYCV